MCERDAANNSTSPGRKTPPLLTLFLYTKLHFSFRLFSERVVSNPLEGQDNRVRENVIWSEMKQGWTRLKYTQPLQMHSPEWFESLDPSFSVEFVVQKASMLRLNGNANWRSVQDMYCLQHGAKSSQFNTQQDQSDLSFSTTYDHLYTVCPFEH